MNLKYLETFIEVMSLGSTKGAADALGISQSGVSRQINQLEKELGVTLFDRYKNKLIPRIEAFAFLDTSKSIKKHANKMESIASDIKSGIYVEKSIKIAIPYTLARNILPELVSKIQEINNKIQIEIITGTYDQIEDFILNDEADFGFIKGDMNRRFNYHKLLKSKSVLICKKNSEFSKYKEITGVMLKKIPLILLGKNSESRQRLEAFFHLNKIKPNVRVEVHSISLACDLVEKGHGLAISSNALLTNISDLGLNVVPIIGLEDDIFGLVSFKEKKLSDSVNRSIQVLFEILISSKNSNYLDILDINHKEGELL
ncbi:LysR substrate-binding domain-containing protein [Marinomonas polaris]|uniref:LysR family transcriptional regulator n=1 Tax=Marinomonas polaris TaxID=293552 RepID=UPI003510E75E